MRIINAAAPYAVALMLSLSAPASAWAHDHRGHHWGGGHSRWHDVGPVAGLLALGAVVIEGTAAVLSAPFYALGEISGPRYYEPQRYYGPPSRQYYYAPPPVYVQPPTVVYPPPPAYYPPPNYGPPPGYYRPY